MHRWFRLALPALLCAWPLPATLHAQSPERVTIDAHAPTTPFPHFWEQIFGSGRAILSLRQAYRDDIRSVHKVADFKYVRFHAILHDEVGVYNEDEHGNPVYNFSYVDQIYDGLLANGVKPLVEIVFFEIGEHRVFEAYIPDDALERLVDGAAEKCCERQSLLLRVAGTVELAIILSETVRDQCHRKAEALV